MQSDITWTAHEHAHTEKGSDWFWALGIIAVSSAVVALLFRNVLFALLILVGTFTLALLSAHPPRKRTFRLTPRGLLIDTALYPYQLLVAFWIEGRETEHPTLIVDAQRFLTPHLVIPLEGVDAEAVHAYLSNHLPEKELHEPLGQRLMEYFGF